MSILSVAFRFLALAAAIATIVFYIRCGNELQKLSDALERERQTTSNLRADLAGREVDYEELKAKFDTTALELAEHKRDQRLREGEVLIVKQELEKLRQRLGQQEQTNAELAEANESLRRENIDLKAQGFDPQNDPTRLTARIESQREQIELLETQLDDARTVLTSLFEDRKAIEPKRTIATRIHRALPERRILVLEAGARDGLREDLEFNILSAGNLIAKVKAARVTSDLSVVNILSNPGGEEWLRPGTRIEFTL